MRLKSLEIKGFKSFADKTLILLDNPITGIVGPNGCGKSNIVDAIRWVIGEHKIKSLRSDNLEDLIFNGSRTRTASGMAEVSLTFENTRNLLPTEFNTVTITRKFYKNGESEYRLNDVSCRLKDIHNLFLDTGVSNDSYAIIELGMVDDIIKDKDGARRRMVEQAAGISIYKTRKKEAKQKLDATEQDISRIEDILFEIGNNLRTLESQAKKAEKYFVVKKEYRDVSIELAKASLEQFNQQYKNLNAQHDTETDIKVKLEAEVATGEAELELRKVLLIEKEDELNSLQKQFNDLTSKIYKLESDKKLSTQKLEHLKERSKSLSDFLLNAGVQQRNLEGSVSLYEQKIKEECAELEIIKVELENLRIAVDEKRKAFDEKKQALELLRSEHRLKQRNQFDTEKKLAIAETTVINWQRTVNQVMEEQKNRITLIEQLTTDRAETEHKLALKQEELGNKVKLQEEVKQKILDSQERMETLRAILVEENRKLDAKRNEHDLLKSLVESLEGYPDSIKFLKKNSEWNNKSPLLSDVFVVKNEFRAALENVLDSYLNYYVVSDIKEALRALALLEKNKKGKANFFLLSQVSSVQFNQFDAPSGTVPALNVVAVDEQYSELGKRLLGNVFIVEDEEKIEEMDIAAGALLVTKTGKTVRGKYILGGGSVGLFEGNKIGRAKNLERLVSEIQALQSNTTSLKQQLIEVQKQAAGFNSELNDKAIEAIKQEINRLQNLCVNLTHKRENFDQLNVNNDKRIAEIQTQINGNQNNIVSLRQEHESVNEIISKIEKNIVEAETDFKSVDLGYNEVSQKYNQHNIAYTRQHSKLDGLKQELKFRSNQLNDLKRQVASNSEQTETIKRQLDETSQQLIATADELFELLKNKETEERNLNDKDREYYGLRNNISAQEGQLNQKRREKDHAETLLLNINDKINTMKLQVTGMKERLAFEFKVDLNVILDEERTNDMTVAALTAESEKIKKRIDNMGEINPTAIEAYTEIKARHDFITEQRNDLLSAKDSLLSTIEEVELTANTKFSETYNLVRENFVQVFKTLFTAEDNCDLRLTEPENIADSNIEIYAQPKGKKPSTLTQLSGGEKTLTSTAFLFAIYLIKPAPFCILDEVDAPLDDANVGKFTNMIRKFSTNSQFIIVTHNKQTMASVDVIYGVTMQELGVSKLVPVDFRSLN